ncbi:uncharacterized protein LOC110724075 [Chenopodium quinoa]|uniref:uncharacterized protein LOC110724075 n=1 Tax=Chenopodium quinoa TaxID=63459 RepID=UPI000B774453|nr:uncharacterized protein LOC110724075 [Chenopodium quinoa]
MYEDVGFGKIVLRTWMLFIDKAHLRETLKDYAVQEGFALNVVAADNTRYTVTCYAECCEWRLHASRLIDGKTWAIKKIWPDVHNYRGLETYNPICTVKWVAPKVMEDIRAAPDIPGKALNELLFQRYGIYMKQAYLYRLKRYVIQELFGGHDESYSLMPRYADMNCQTNSESKAFVAWQLSESIPRVNLFTSVFISFAGQWKGFLAGCRPLIGVDGAHLKGNYGGILLFAVGLDGNNEIYPIALAIVSVEDKESWSYFFWHLYNIVKQSNRQHWTIISDRQKRVDLALKDVWPDAKRRYCCRHLSRNYKKEFPVSLMYTLFWRACNATNKFTFRKAMERLQKEGGEDVMVWCRPVLTLLEGIRRVCMVRIASRHERAQGWEDNDLCPKIAKLVRDISKATSTCRAFQSSPGEYEIHEGRSQFPLNLNQNICSCGAWQVSGIPCRHAVRAMLHAKVDPHNYVSSWYSARTYKQVYNFVIHPIPDSSQWPPVDATHPQHIHPPKMKRGVGRPSRNRKREEGEDQPGKRSRIVRCSNCGNLGHNKATCKGGLTGKELESVKAMVVRNTKSRDQSNAAKEARAMSAATKISSSQLASQPQDLSQSP